MIPTSILLSCVLAQAQPVAFTSVALRDAFWAPRQRVNADATLDQNFSQCESTGRIENLRLAGDPANAGKGGYRGYFFNDSDVFKALEGAADVYALTRDPALAGRMQSLVGIIAGAQQADGYLNAYFTIEKPAERWSNLKDKHELYCAGHLIEAGVAHHRATGSRDLLDVAVRLADHIDARFGPPPKEPGVCGHPEVELSLLRLARETGEARYAALARHFLNERGRSERRPLFGEYAQDHAPLVDQDRVVGHAVRAMYLYSAAAEVAAAEGDEALAGTLDRLFDNLTLRKMYLTGGIGNSASNEGFTTDYDLPNESAYAETCAGIGLVFWAHRMNLLHADARYADVLERVLYNAAISGVSLDGRSFFYVNPMSSQGGTRRQPWFSCACCPPNILRLVASVGEYFYVTDDDGIRVNLYGAGTASARVAGQDISLRQETNYPWDGEVVIHLDVASPAVWTLRLRVPSWAAGSGMTINGEAATPIIASGYAVIRREWKRGDVVRLTLPMPPRLTVSNPRVRGNRGLVAVERGPIVYCAEGDDNPEGVRSVVLPSLEGVTESWRADHLGGIVELRVPARRAVAPIPADDLYAGAPGVAPATLTLIPYATWANRGAGEMAVWFPQASSLALGTSRTWITPTSSHTYHGDQIGALCDGVAPEKSSDGSVPRATWWPRQGTDEWVRYDFDRERVVSEVGVAWFDDTGAGGGCALPSRWHVEYLDEGVWKPVAPAAGQGYGVAPDCLNRVRITPVRTRSLRLTATLREGRSSGILEWDVVAR